MTFKTTVQKIEEKIKFINPYYVEIQILRFCYTKDRCSTCEFGVYTIYYPKCLLMRYLKGEE